MDALEVETIGDSHIIRLAGDIDLSNADGLAVQVLGSFPGGVTRAVIDLDRVTYVDSTAIRLLFEIRHELADAGIALRVVLLTGSRIRRALELTGFTRTVPMFESVTQALA